MRGRAGRPSTAAFRRKTYRFRVVACNNDGVWNEAGATWNFSIVPGFYQTIWFQGLCLLAGAGLSVKHHDGISTFSIGALIVAEQLGLSKGLSSSFVLF